MIKIYLGIAQDSWQSFVFAKECHTVSTLAFAGHGHPMCCQQRNALEWWSETVPSGFNGKAIGKP